MWIGPAMNSHLFTRINKSPCKETRLCTANISSLKTLCYEIMTSTSETVIQLDNITKSEAMEVHIPELVQPVLSEYQAVFQEPKGLPPIRNREHAINLQP